MKQPRRRHLILDVSSSLRRIFINISTTALLKQPPFRIYMKSIDYENTFKLLII